MAGDDEKKAALDELKELIRTSLSLNNKHDFSSLTPSAPTPTPKVEAIQTPTPVVTPEEKPETEPEVFGVEVVSIYGVPLLRDERSDVILLKFLKAKDFKVEEAFTMIKNTLIWRQEFGIDAALLDEKEEKKGLGKYLEEVVFLHGCDREGRPVCYHAYGEFKNKDLYVFTFSDEARRQKFVRWMIIFLEKIIRRLDFTPGGISTIVHIIDMNNFPGYERKEFHQATDKALHLFQDNYPDFVAKQVLINAPWWLCAFHMITKSKYVCAWPSKSAETLFKYITPLQVPVQYEGLINGGEMGFSLTDLVHEIEIGPVVRQMIEFSVSEGCVFVWEIRVIRGEMLLYGVDFVPTAQDGYIVTLVKTKMISSISKKKGSSILDDHRSNKKSSSEDESGICKSFKVPEPGKIIINISNFATTKKRFLFRSTTKTERRSSSSSVL